MAQTLH